MRSDDYISPQYDDEIDLKQFFSVLWAGRAIIIIITMLFAVSSVMYAISVPNKYKASILLASAQSGSGFSSSVGQLGGLASFAGISIDSGSSSEAQVAVEVMKSRSFIEDFIRQNDLAVKIYAAEGWDVSSGNLLINSDVYDSKKKKWVSVKGAPSSYSLYKSFIGLVSVSVNVKSGWVAVSIEHYSPKVAKQILDLYVSAINEHMKTRQMDKVERNIVYLEEQIRKTSIAEMREVFYTIIEEQIKSKMLAEASPDYVFVAVSPSMIPEERSQAKRASISITGALTGVFISTLLVLALHFIRRFV